jgi:alpha-L-arabinofuranosidase
MLKPQNNLCRSLFNLDGIWEYAKHPGPNPETGFEREGLLAVPASWNEQHNELALFITNRSEESCEFSCQLPPASAIKKSVTMYCNDHKAVNGPGDEKIAPQLLTAALENNSIKAELPPVSWNMIVVQL